MSYQERLRIRPRGWLVLVPLALTLFFAYRWLGVISADSLFSMNASCQFFLIILGVLVAIKPDIGVKRPWAVIGAFVLIGGVGMVAAIRQQQVAARETAEAQRQTAEANLKLANSIENVNNAATEIARVQGLNTELQQRLLQSSGEILSQGKTISGLSQKAADTARQAVDTARLGIETVTGGEGFCYMFFEESPSGNPATVVFGNPGKTPLYDVEVMVLDLQHFDRLRLQDPNADVEPAFTSISVGGLAPNGRSLTFQKHLPFNTGNLDRQDYQIGYDGRNGWWIQDLIVKRVGDGWATASRVSRTDGVNEKLVFTKVDQNFPGKPDWRESEPTPLRQPVLNLDERFRRMPKKP